MKQVNEMIADAGKPLKIMIDTKYKFITVFNPESGFYMRTGILEDNQDTGIDPFMASFPHLLDIGIMGTCKNKNYCKVGCYQGNINKPNMSFKNFKKIIKQIKGKTFEIALGGNGSPNEHENFIDIIKYTRENDIIPNYTTSGIELTDEQIKATKDYCGAVAVSFYNQPYTFSAIERFLNAECKTNIHYVLGNDSIDEALFKLKNNLFPKGINAVIFLMYKPIGCIKPDNVLKFNDLRVVEFYNLIQNNTFEYKIGLDACHLPALCNFSTKINKIITTPCDGGSYSAYITSDFWMLPCSFDTIARNYAVNLNEYSIEEAWNNIKFDIFRDYHRNSCKDCKDQNNCRGGCPLIQEINLCNKEERGY